MATIVKKARLSQLASDQEKNVERTVSEIIEQVKNNGDAAIRDLSSRLDQWSPSSFRLPTGEISDIISRIPDAVINDIKFAQQQIRNFARKQRESIRDIEEETLPGVFLGHKNIPVENVGCYIPGGRYPMVASAHMSIVTARVAGVERVIACTPPINGKIPEYTVCAMHLAGADEIYILGGVQAMVAMALGTQTMRAVDMIVGPGNAYVAEAKRQLFGKVGIDLLAGPTEILVIADDSADVEMIACDLLSQAEHGPNSPAILITTSPEIARNLGNEVSKQLATLATAAIAERAWDDYGQIILVDSDDEAIAEADRLAFEHVEVLTRDPQYYLDRLRNYGALFLGKETNVTYGDKVIGTNHTLPTKKAARYTGGLWVGKFLKNCTYQRCTPAASAAIGEYAMRLCELEGFHAHRKQAALRVQRYGEPNEIGR